MPRLVNAVFETPEFGSVCQVEGSGSFWVFLARQSGPHRGHRVVPRLDDDERHDERCSQHEVMKRKGVRSLFRPASGRKPMRGNEDVSGRRSVFSQRNGDVHGTCARCTEVRNDALPPCIAKRQLDSSCRSQRRSGGLGAHDAMESIGRDSRLLAEARKNQKAASASLEVTRPRRVKVPATRGFSPPFKPDAFRIPAYERRVNGFEAFGSLCPKTNFTFVV